MTKSRAPEWIVVAGNPWRIALEAKRLGIGRDLVWFREAPHEVPDAMVDICNNGAEHAFPPALLARMQLIGFTDVKTRPARRSERRAVGAA